MPDTTNEDTTAEWDETNEQHDHDEPELAIEVAEPDPLPAPPSKHDPACHGAKKHQPNCGCTGDARGPF